jgi:hypothetical protein
MSRKISDTTRKVKILLALQSQPMNQKELAQVLGHHKINTLVADLRADRLVITNPLTKKLELYRDVEIMVK